jgi:hypothetical protein
MHPTGAAAQRRRKKDWDILCNESLTGATTRRAVFRPFLNGPLDTAKVMFPRQKGLYILRSGLKNMENVALSKNFL